MYSSRLKKVGRLLKPHNIHTAFRPVCQLLNLLFNSKPKTSPLDLLGVIYLILCRDGDSVYNGETGHTAGIRLKEDKQFFEKCDMRYKIIIHSLYIDHIPSFENIKMFGTGCKYYEARIFQDSWRTAT